MTPHEAMQWVGVALGWLLIGAIVGLVVCFIRALWGN